MNVVKIYIYLFFLQERSIIFLEYIFAWQNCFFFVFTKTKTFLLSRVTGYGYCLFLADQPKFYNRRYE